MNKRRETVLKDERKKRKSIETEWKGSLTVEASVLWLWCCFRWQPL